MGRGRGSWGGSWGWRGEGRELGWHGGRLEVGESTSDRNGGAVDSLGKGLSPVSALPYLCVLHGATLLKGMVLCVRVWFSFFPFFSFF